jgi:hypothetical protein
MATHLPELPHATSWLGHHAGGGKPGTLEVGDELDIHIRLAGDARVRVVHTCPCSITLATLEGHPEAWRITFGAYRDANGHVVFHEAEPCPLDHLGARHAGACRDGVLMRELAIFCGVGALCGSRSMLGPALVSRHLLPPAASGLLATLAAGELMADKSSQVGDRTDPLPLAARVVLGAITAGAYASRPRRAQAALIGAAGALAGAYVFNYLRRVATTRLGVANAAAGVFEDVLALGAGSMLLRRDRPEG